MCIIVFDCLTHEEIILGLTSPKFSMESLEQSNNNERLQMWSKRLKSVEHFEPTIATLTSSHILPSVAVHIQYVFSAVIKVKHHVNIDNE